MRSVSDETSDVRWRSVPPEDVVWLCWGQDHIAFHRQSGVTHFLNSSSRQLVTDVLSESKGVTEVLEEFGATQTDADWSIQRDEMFLMLNRLENLGFLVRS